MDLLIWTLEHVDGPSGAPDGSEIDFVRLESIFAADAETRPDTIRQPLPDAGDAEEKGERRQ